ncbi:MAG: hypothetical protein K9G70_15360 [Prolixibacteraceae bacterium]|nr:hypothetical protein [Prolixibacteraceae bacterium]
MAKTKVLITVKTYPAISTKYEELVCTAGFLEDGTWIRIYPVQFRKKSYAEQYSKYDWIDLDLVKNKSDFRPESYRFKDEAGTISKLMIEDWETGQLYWNSLKRHDGNEKKACEDVRKKYFDDFAKTKDLHFFLGTTQVHHYRARNPFIIIGTFHPKPIVQYKLF